MRAPSSLLGSLVESAVLLALLYSAVPAYSMPLAGHEDLCTRLVSYSYRNGTVSISAIEGYCVAVESLRLGNTTITIPAPAPCMRTLRIGGAGSPIPVPLDSLEPGEPLMVNFTVRGPSGVACRGSLTINALRPHAGSHGSPTAATPPEGESAAGTLSTLGRSPGGGLNSLVAGRPFRAGGESDTLRVGWRELGLTLAAAWTVLGVSAVCGASRRR